MPVTITEVDVECPVTVVELPEGERLCHAIECPNCHWLIWPESWSPRSRSASLERHTITVNGGIRSGLCPDSKGGSPSPSF